VLRRGGRVPEATYTKFLTSAGVGDGAWLAEVEDATERALRTRGEATGAQLTRDVPQLQNRLLLAEGKPYASNTNITIWVLVLLAAEGRIVRGRPRGSWSGSHCCRGSTRRRWAGSGVPGTSASTPLHAELAAAPVTRP
jgi:hypothetical protein